MAESINVLWEDFISTIDNGRDIYPWEDWLNGEIWIITLGQDTRTNNFNAFRAQVSKAAKRFGKKARAAKVENGKKIAIQALPK